MSGGGVLLVMFRGLELQLEGDEPLILLIIMYNQQSSYAHIYP